LNAQLNTPFKTRIICIYQTQRYAMLLHHPELPKPGDQAPAFSAISQKGLIEFPAYSAGYWCIFFSHPANFTSAWKMYSTFMALKERWFNERNTKLLGLCHEPVRPNDWSDKARRYIGIYLNAPVIEDPDDHVASLFGMASWRRNQEEFNRWAYIIDPDGMVRLVLCNPLPSIENAILDLGRAIDQLQGNSIGAPKPEPITTFERSDADTAKHYKLNPAYFYRRRVKWN
jgi:alkyl hydroperoxide reductase subunit AhpC